jgi:hypothetical protein
MQQEWNAPACRKKARATAGRDDADLADKSGFLLLSPVAQPDEVGNSFFYLFIEHCLFGIVRSCDEKFH